MCPCAHVHPEVAVHSDSELLYGKYRLFCFYCDHPYLHSFPTRRSSDLVAAGPRGDARDQPGRELAAPPARLAPPDRKSTRLNSSHSSISYAVFCLKKKKPSCKIALASFLLIYAILWYLYL